MTRDQVKEILDRVLTWPPEDQEKLKQQLDDVEKELEHLSRQKDEKEMLKDLADTLARFDDPGPQVDRRVNERRA